MDVEETSMDGRVTESPLVSVIITTYGEPDSLERAICCVFEQDYPAIELIVVDDNDPCSEFRRKTETVVSPYAADGRIAYVKHERNLNGAAARNTGFAHARGAYITYLDNDDVMLPRRVGNAVRALERSQDADAVLCGVAVLEGSLIAAMRKPDLAGGGTRMLLLNDWALGTGSNIFLTRRSATELGGFDTAFRRNQDVEYMLRFFRSHNAVRIDSFDLVKGSSGTSNFPSYEVFKAAKERLDVVFSDDIASLGKSGADEYRRQEARVLYEVALRNGDGEGIADARNLMRSLGVKPGMKSAAHWLSGRFPRVAVTLLFFPRFMRSRRYMKMINADPPTGRSCGNRGLGMPSEHVAQSSSARIESKDELMSFIRADRAAAGWLADSWRARAMASIKTTLRFGSTGWSLAVLRANRKLEYRANNAWRSPVHRVVYLLSLLRYRYMERRARCEIPINAIGPGMRLWHFEQGSVIINPEARIGRCFSISANCVVGHADGKAPCIGDCVDMSIGSMVLGGISVADDTLVGAGAVVVKDVDEPGMTVVGVPGRAIAKTKSAYERLERRERVMDVLGLTGMRERRMDGNA